MPATTLIFNSTVNRVSVVKKLDVYKGRLLAATVVSVHPLLHQAEAYIKLDLITTGQLRTKSLISLASGYLTSMYEVAWHGNLPIETDFAVQVTCFAHDEITLQFTILTDIG